jgi:hypothetical protein
MHIFIEKLYLLNCFTYYFTCPTDIPKKIKKIKNIPHGGLQDEIFYIIIVLTTTVVAKKLGSLKVCFNSIFYLKERLPRK